ncbi:MAG: hypothetical protein HYR90_04540 [Candidatus Andersenbacteria bacterium]|nr:hypothetical protein [Candidatus Andersenbacteria bacterium]MBI3250459.1 hypothetical protein [Candidatus Andersenbacteria bacterium]
MMKLVQKRNTKFQTNLSRTDAWNAVVTDAALKAAFGEGAPSRKESSVRATLRRAARLIRGGFALEIDVEGLILELNVPGVVSRYQIAPVITALEIAAGVAVTRRSLLQIAQRLQSFMPPKGYLSISKTKEGAQLLDDTAASTPESMLAGLKTLAAIGKHRRLAVLENPPPSVAAISPQYADMILVVGDTNATARDAIHASENDADTHHFQTSAEAKKWMSKYIKSTDTILISGT